MADKKTEIEFGIGTILREGAPTTAVVVRDQVLALSDLAARHPALGTQAPSLMRDLLTNWDRWHDWLRGCDLKPTPDEGWKPLDSIKFKAPVAEPWNIFQTYHNYERPSRSTGHVDPPKSERVLPDIFLGSRSALAGYGDAVYREHGGTQFDFELEITAVVGKAAYRVPAEKADDYIAGYVIANDFTMHFSWWRKFRDRSRINDNIRMKNFPGYTPLSRAIIPRDLVGLVNNLALKVTVDGQLRQDTRTNKMLWTVQELVEYLSHIMPLQPGDLILTGSPEELPLPPGETKGVKDGQLVICEVEKIGRLENRVLQQAERQPKEP